MTITKSLLKTAGLLAVSAGGLSVESTGSSNELLRSPLQLVGCSIILWMIFPWLSGSMFRFLRVALSLSLTLLTYFVFESLGFPTSALLDTIQIKFLEVPEVVLVRDQILFLVYFSIFLLFYFFINVRNVLMRSLAVFI